MELRPSEQLENQTDRIRLDRVKSADTGLVFAGVRGVYSRVRGVYSRMPGECTRKTPRGFKGISKMSSQQCANHRTRLLSCKTSAHDEV